MGFASTPNFKNIYILPFLLGLSGGHHELNILLISLDIVSASQV